MSTRLTVNHGAGYIDIEEVSDSFWRIIDDDIRRTGKPYLGFIPLSDDVTVEEYEGRFALLLNDGNVIYCRR